MSGKRIKKMTPKGEAYFESSQPIDAVDTEKSLSESESTGEYTDDEESKLTLKMQELEEIIDKKNSIISQNDDEINQLKNSNKQIRGNKNNLEKDFQTKTKTNEELNTKNVELVQNNKQLIEKSYNLEKQIKVLKETVQAQSTTNTLLQHQITKQQQHFEDIENDFNVEVNEKVVMVNEMKSDLIQRSTKIIKLEEIISTNQESIVSLKESICREKQINDTFMKLINDKNDLSVNNVQTHVTSTHSTYDQDQHKQHKQEQQEQQQQLKQQIQQRQQQLQQQQHQKQQQQQRQQQQHQQQNKQQQQQQQQHQHILQQQHHQQPQPQQQQHQQQPQQQQQQKQLQQQQHQQQLQQQQQQQQHYQKQQHQQQQHYQKQQQQQQQIYQQQEHQHQDYHFTVSNSETINQATIHEHNLNKGKVYTNANEMPLRNVATQLTNSNQMYSKAQRKILILSASITKPINMAMFNEKVVNGRAVKRAHGGATTQRLKHYVKGDIEIDNPDTVIINGGTNNLSKTNQSVEEITEEILDIVYICRQHGIKNILVSSITCRPEFQGKIDDINRLLQENAVKYSYVFIDNGNINKIHLKRDKLHLNHQGAILLANNFLLHLNRPCVTYPFNSIWD